MYKSILKTMLISKFKFLTILKNPQLLCSSILAIAFCAILKTYIPIEQLEAQPLFIITTGLIFSFAMGGVMLTALPLSSDKENNILRVLMVSTISPTNYLLGSLLPPFLIVFLTNLILGIFWLPKEIPFIYYLIITSIGTIISLSIGLIVGFYSFNQMTASSLCIPIIFIFSIIPILRTMSSDFEKYSKFLYTSQILNYLSNLYDKKINPLTTEIVSILSATFTLSLLICIYGYKKNKFDS
ncbi:ABC transporter permease [Carnobacterium maltaromaticum]|uniref:ABC transporter permease n=1 Tax=Carnobacterium maltaromaticum TaxID=2751 RepID=UPI00298B0E13|nr:ABC transporter permease [Carnobacterium maltaromaticum]MDW5524130.1 ABC transporter permease [Carnobacterium maltaromaticum]